MNVLQRTPIKSHCWADSAGCQNTAPPLPEKQVWGLTVTVFLTALRAPVLLRFLLEDPYQFLSRLLF